jgi:Carboxypeptidase regulatory-like domain
MNAHNMIYLAKQTNRKCITLSIAMFCLISISGFSQIQGGVFDLKKQGIANAVVLAIDSSGIIKDSARSDQRGFYMFKGLPTGKYRIEATARGFRTAVYENIIANKEFPLDEDSRIDISNATRLEIVLKSSNAP